MDILRCANIDWLECYCLEDSIGYPHDADYFRRKGWEVKERDYGTPMYRQMFTLYDHYSEPFLEVRRVPKSDEVKVHGLFNQYSCHVRLCNRACYADNAAGMMIQFLAENGFAFQRISRIDLCYDFEKFDFGDLPAKFLKRFMEGKYSKINQANISAHGLDQWDGRIWNSVSWGSNKSMVRTRFYNKTLEIRQSKDKPYIRQAWQRCGLVDDMHTLEKKESDGTVYKPDIWRVEFAIKSGTKGWFVVEDYQGERKRILSYPNSLDVYDSREKVWNVFLSLTRHYFHFKVVEYLDKEKTSIQRKDRCQDKKLFNYDIQSVFYQIDKLAKTENEVKERYDILIARLLAYRERQIDPKIVTACNTIIEALERQVRVANLTNPVSETEMEILRRIINDRMHRHDVPLSVDREQAKAMIEVERKIWANPF